MELLYKSYSHKVNDVSDQGIVDIYVNAYGNEDADGDISATGSFNKTAAEQKDRMRHLINHDKYNPDRLAGFPIELHPEDPVGFRVLSKMNLKKQSIRDVFEDYKMFADHNKSLEHSIGYKIIKRSESEPKMVTEYKVGEYSTITFHAANPLTPMVGFKSLQTPEEIIETLEFFNLLLKKANYSDEKFIKIEQTVKSLNDTVSSLAEPRKHSEPKTLAEIIRASTAKVQNMNL